jgi:hypothetical protein
MIFHEPISKRDQCIDLVRPVINATTATDDSNILHTSITLRPFPRHRCTVPQRLEDADAANAHCSTSTPSPLLSTPKMMPSLQQVEQRRTSPSSDLGDPCLGFPPELLGISNGGDASRPFATARTKNASAPRSSGEVHSDRVIRNDVNAAQKCGRFVSLRTLRGRSSLPHGPRTSRPGSDTYALSPARHNLRPARCIYSGPH